MQKLVFIILYMSLLVITSQKEKVYANASSEKALDLWQSYF